MFRINKIYLAVITILFVTLIALEHYSPKPVDWSETYNINGKTPYSCYILNDLLDTIFPAQKIEYNFDSFYVSLDSNSVEKKNIIIITNDFNPDQLDLDALLKFVDKGNDLFVSSSNYGHLFLDRFKMKLESPVISSLVLSKGKESLFLQNPELKNDSGYYYNKKLPLVYISAFDTLNAIKLGTNRTGKVNFISTKHGLGKIYIHTQPQVFTNYHLLYGNVEYASKVLSYLPIRETVWDGYYKPDRFINTSPMRYILSQDALRSGYYLLLVTLLLYLVVESKRRQRVIPIVKSLENRSLQFVKTIGSLYFNQRNNADLARKKLIFFKEFLREHYFINIISSTSNCITMVSLKSGVSSDLVKQLLNSADYYETKQSVADVELIELNRKMEMFYKQCL